MDYLELKCEWAEDYLRVGGVFNEDDMLRIGIESEIESSTLTTLLSEGKIEALVAHLQQVLNNHKQHGQQA